MIYKESFQVANKVFEVTTLKKLTAKQIDAINVVLNYSIDDLNHNVANASAWKFNNAQINIGIYVQPEFINYYNYVYDLYLQYPDTFNPYSTQTYSPNNISIDQSKKMVIKNIDYKFDTSYFRNTFILEYLTEYLNEIKIKEYLISFDGIFTARGANGWIISHEDFTYTLVNSSAQFFNYEPSGFKVHKFGALNNELKESVAVVVAMSPAKIKILTPQVQYVNTKTDLVKFCEENKLEVFFQNN